MTSDETIDIRPVFRVPVRPTEVPAELLALPADVPVIGIERDGTHHCTAGKLVGYFESTIERQASGRFYLWEAAQSLAEAYGIDASGEQSEMVKGFKAGKLRIYNTNDGERDTWEKLSPCDSFVTPTDINEWITTRGPVWVGRRFPDSPSATPQSAPVSGLTVPATSDALLEEMRKTREAIEQANRNAENRDTHARAHAGFQQIAAATKAEPEPEAVAPAPTGVAGKRWTDEFKAEVSAYRKEHGTKAAALKFNVSDALIRRHLPADKPPPRGFSAFSVGTKGLR